MNAFWALNSLAQWADYGSPLVAKNSNSGAVRRRPTYGLKTIVINLRCICQRHMHIHVATAPRALRLCTQCIP